MYQVALADVGFGGLPFGYVPAHELLLVDLLIDEGLIGGLVLHSEALVDPGPGTSQFGEDSVHVEADEVVISAHGSGVWRASRLAFFGHQRFYPSRCFARTWTRMSGSTTRTGTM